MTHGVDGMILAIFVMLVCALFGSPGCNRGSSDRLVIATSWPLAEQRRIESEFQHWVLQSSMRGGPGPVRLEWRILAPGDDLVRVARRRDPPDMLLGVPALPFDRLARMQALAPLPIDGSPSWCIARRARLGSTFRPPAGFTFNDPRNDLQSLAWAKSVLGNGSFQQGYSRLVREAGHPRRIGRRAGSTWPAIVECVAIPREGRHQELAQSFLRFLAATAGAASPPGNSGTSTTPGADALLADLLGATLVDAQDELWAAWTALERTGYPETALKWMTEPPPWPPASVTKLLGRPGEPAMLMVQELAGQVAPDPTVRAWLVRSWLAQPRLLDQALLDELAGAAGGQLIHEPRFRDWLRAEWTAWARQRYRRVARLVGTAQ
jgi:hypothetical protein